VEGATNLNLSAHQGVRALMERWLVAWCVAMHNSLTWPRNGRYQCRTACRPRKALRLVKRSVRSLDFGGQAKLLNYSY
jgi:hypothetical protein